MIKKDRDIVACGAVPPPPKLVKGEITIEDDEYVDDEAYFFGDYQSVPNGKKICERLRKIRIDFARKHGIFYEPAECHNLDECAGTCPKCESEKRYLEEEYEKIKRHEIMSISRFRMDTDGKGITTLVAFWGCPLQCKFCINDECHDPNTRKISVTPNKLYHELKKDDLYFRESGGGVVFGGGEPLIHSEYIKRATALMPCEWSKRIETSLNVDWCLVEPLLDVIDEWIIDVKAIGSASEYKRYTGCSEKNVLINLQRLSEIVDRSKIFIRLPEIPGYADRMNEDIKKKTIDSLKRITDNIEEFSYITRSRANDAALEVLRKEQEKLHQGLVHDDTPKYVPIDDEDLPFN